MMRWKWQALLLGPLLVMSFGTACSKRDPATDTSPGTIRPVPEARAESGWPLYEVPAEGFALALPPTWRQFDMNPATFEAKFQEALKQNPQLEAMLGNLRQQIAAGIKFFGIDEPSMKTGFATNVNVLRLPVPPGTTLDTAVADTLMQMESLATVTKPIAHERVKLAAGECERLRCKMTMQMPTGQAVAIASTQFILVKGNDVYVLTLTTLSDRDARYTPTFEKIGQGFRFIK